tara:strand:+ start:919 stop:1335 length:417 start_codon:yes stop_codon:yes gene_type:complete
MGYKMKGTTLYGKPIGKGGFTKGGMTVNRTGNDNMADGRAKSSAFQKTDKPTEAELIAQANKQFGEGVKVPQYNKEQTNDAKQMYNNTRTFQSGTWNDLSENEKKKYFEKGIKASKQRAANVKKKKTHKIVKGVWVPK